LKSRKERFSLRSRVEPKCESKSIAVTALILLGTCAVAQEISCDYSNAEFAQFKKYAWASGPSRGGRTREPEHRQLHRRTTVGQRADEGQPRRGATCNGLPPDVVFDRDIRRIGFRDVLRNLRSRGGSKYVLMGMLVVNLVDAHTGAMMRRGVASGDVGANASPKK